MKAARKIMTSSHSNKRTELLSSPSSSADIKITPVMSRETVSSLQTPLDIAEFTLNAKTIGASNGNIGEYSGDIYMLKLAFKSGKIISTQSDFSEKQIKRYRTDFNDAVTEFVKAGIYNHLLPGLSPEISLVVDGIHQDRMYLASKFLRDFSTLHALGNQTGSTLHSITGFAKAMSAMLACGEVDYHANNLGAVGQEAQKMIATIDHGKSHLVFSGINEMRGDMICRMVQNHYKSNLTFNIREFIEGLKEVTAIPTPVVQQIFGNAVTLLLAHQVDFTDVPYRVSNIHRNKDQSKLLLLGSIYGINSTFTNNNGVEITAKFIETFTRQQNLIQELIPYIEGIEAITPEGEKWCDGGWVSMATERGWRTFDYYREGDQVKWLYSSPVTFAVKYQCKIFKHDDTGKVVGIADPLLWAIANDQPLEIIKNNIHYIDQPVLWGIKYQYVVHQYNPTGEIISRSNAVACAIYYQKKIDGCDPTIWAINNNKPVITYSSAGDKQYHSPISYAIRKGSSINGDDATIWAIENEQSIIEYDNSGREISRHEPLIWLINNNIDVKHKSDDGTTIWEHPLYYAIREEKLIDDQDPTVWAIENKCGLIYSDKTDLTTMTDPVICAAKHEVTVDGKDPIWWALLSRHDILLTKDGATENPLMWAIRTDYKIVDYEDGSPVRYVDPVAYAIEERQLIDNKDAIRWASDNAYIISAYDEEGNFIRYIPLTLYMGATDLPSQDKENITAANTRSTYLDSTPVDSPYHSQCRAQETSIDTGLLSAAGMTVLGDIADGECEA